MNYQTDQSVSIGGNLNIGGRVTAAGHAVFTRNVRIEGWLDAPNLRSPCLGLFESVADLTGACREPRPGQWALVVAGNADDGALLTTVCTYGDDGWKTGKTCRLEIDVDLDTKADKSMFVTLSEADYDAMQYKDSETYYFIYET